MSCLSSSPTNLLVGLYSGHVVIDDMERRNAIRVHKNPCRVAIFHDGQARIITGSSKGYLGIVDAECLKPERRIKVQKSAISALSSLDANRIVCADDNGSIFAYDLRVGSDEPASKLLTVHDDYVIKVLKLHTQTAILSISGNGTICMIDTRKWAPPSQTMSIDDELLSCCLIDPSHEQDPEMVLLSTDSGSLVWFDWHAQENFSRKNNSGNAQANGMVSIDSETVLLGCEDGSIHAMDIHAGFRNGSTPIHSIDESIENIVFMSDKQMVGVSAMDKCVHVFPCTNNQSKPKQSTPSRNFFDDLME